MDMQKKLTRTGNSLALVLDKPLLEQLGLDADTPVEVSTNGDVIVISRVRPKKRQDRVLRAATKIHARYAGVFKRLAE